ncbi:MAG TPA: hypothetical protein VMO88_01880, partial [Acidimicrobiales bacterium]|nr:hypothetical protein [Acidimicrobiales bacterium]
YPIIAVTDDAGRHWRPADIPGAPGLAPTTPTPPVPDTAPVSSSKVSSELNALIGTEAARDADSARATGQPWNGYLSTNPVSDNGMLVAVAAFSFDPAGKPLQILGYSNGTWTLLASLSSPPDDPSNTIHGATPSSWLSSVPGAAIEVSDVTGDGRPDFLIPINAADNVPGSVLSQDGGSTSAPWRYVPFVLGSSGTPIYELGLSPELRGNAVVSTYDNCPTCAQRTNYSIIWTYDRGTGTFRAPNPP